MEQLKQMIMERAGISEEQADQAVGAVKDFMQNNPDKIQEMLPGDVASKVGGFLNR